MISLWVVVGVLSLSSAVLAVHLVGINTRSSRIRKQIVSLVNVRDEIHTLGVEIRGEGKDEDWAKHLRQATIGVSKMVSLDGGRDTLSRQIDSAVIQIGRRLAKSKPDRSVASGNTTAYYSPAGNVKLYEALFDTQHLLGLKFGTLRSRLQGIDREESLIVKAMLAGVSLLVIFLAIVFYREKRKIDNDAKNLELFRQTVGNFPGGIVVVTVRKVDGERRFIITEVNKAAEVMTGVEFKRLKHKDLVEALPESAKIGFTEAITSVIETGKPVNFGERYYKDSVVREGWYSTRVFPLYHDTVGISFEVISKKKEMEMALRESEERWQLVVWGSDDGIWDWNVAEGSIFYSDKWYGITGYERDDGMNHLAQLERYAHPDDRERVVRGLSECLSGKENVFSAEYRILTKGGNYRWVHDRGQAIHSGDGRAIRLAGSTSDIDSRKKTEEALKRERILLRTLVDNIPDAIYVKDTLKRKTISNPADVRNMGFNSEEEILGKDDFDTFPEETARRFSEVDDTVLKGGETVLNKEEFFFDREGTKRWLMTSKVPLRDGHGRIVGLVGIGHDITNRKKIEEGLRESQKRLSEVIEFFPAPTMIVNREGKVLSWNKAMESATGIPAGDMVGKGNYEYAIPFYRERRPILIDKVIKGDTLDQGRYADMKVVGDTVWAGTFVTLQNGKETYFMGSATALRNSKGEITGGIETLLDLSEIKRTELLLRASEERFRMISENVVDMIALLTPDFSCLYCSPSFVRDGIDPSSMVGKDFLSHVHPDDAGEIRGVTRSAVDDHNYKTLQFRFSGDGKAWKIKAGTVSDVMSENGEQVMIVMRDITDQIRHEKERQELQNQLQTRNAELERTLSEMDEIQKGLVQSEKLASIGQLVAGVAHEINNPLAFVHCNINRFDEYFHEFVELNGKWRCAAESASKGDITIGEMVMEMRALEEKVESVELTEDFEKLMSQTKSGTERIKKIVEQLRGFTHLSDDGVTLAEINSALDDTLAIVWNEIKYKAEVKKEYGDIPKVTCNLGEIKQVFVNLLVNASQAIESKGEITVRTSVNGPYVVIEIIDTGSGISQKNLERIFDPFFTTKPVGKGTGLGLWVSTSIIQKHAGKLLAESEEGKGTRMTVMLPIDGEAG